MNIFINPGKELRAEVLKRPQIEAEDLEQTISEVFQSVSRDGDEALRTFTERFDKVNLAQFKVTPEEWSEGIATLSATLKEAIDTAASNIAKFHASQQIDELPVETMPGVTCWRKSVPIDAVGLYIPGGTAPLFSTVLMLGIPAQIAGCPKRMLCTPPAPDGQLHPAILYAAQAAGITEVYKIGGAQAIAAMAVGTETIPAVDKIFGPGNQYVMAAKQYAQRMGVAMDLPAGPSEVLVATDDSVPAAFVAADLLAQAEHGTDSQVVFLTDSEAFVTEVTAEITAQMNVLPRNAIAAKALENSVAMVLPPNEWADLINQYAPEHLILAGKYEQEVVQNVRHAGSVFLGQFTAESFGDYASGTNHTLPTAGYARAWSGVSLDSFVRKVTFQRVTKDGLHTLGPIVIRMAEAEELQGHANAVAVRLNDTPKNV